MKHSRWYVPPNALTNWPVRPSPHLPQIFPLRLGLGACICCSFCWGSVMERTGASVRSWGVRLCERGALWELEVEVDQKGVEQVDLSTKNPVILANLLKRFLRVMPDPVLTLKLYRLFMTANGMYSHKYQRARLTAADIEDEDKRKKVLHLVLCLLPKAHRDTMEVLFCFLNWVSSFHTVDEESGNKMDTWNIATVMAPNILRESNDKEVRSVDQGAVKVVFDLIENNDEFSEVCLRRHQPL